jgi:hypothetical protein
MVLFLLCSLYLSSSSILKTAGSWTFLSYKEQVQSLSPLRGEVYQRGFIFG